MHLLECHLFRYMPPKYICPMSIFFFPSPLLPPESQLFVTVTYWKLVVVVITLEGVEKMAIREGDVPRQTF